MPARRERTRFRFPVADDARHDQLRIVERRAISVRQRIAELAAFMDRAGHFGRDVARHAIRPRKLTEQTLDALAGMPDRGIAFRIAAFEVGIGHQARPAVAGADDVDHVETVRADQPV